MARREENARRNRKRPRTDWFSSNPLLPPDNVFFPERCMGYRLAEWPMRPATDFANRFRPVVAMMR
jgi:hypothetical protein